MVAVIAHRGASAAAPENTVEAFRLARRLGADWVELDVRRTADGALVVAPRRPARRRPGHRRDRPSADLPPPVPDLADGARRLRRHGRQHRDQEPARRPRLRRRRVGGGRRWWPRSQRRSQPRRRCSCRRSTSPTIDRVRELDPAVPTAFLVARSARRRSGSRSPPTSPPPGTSRSTPGTTSRRRRAGGAPPASTAWR